MIRIRHILSSLLVTILLSSNSALASFSSFSAIISTPTPSSTPGSNAGGGGAGAFFTSTPTASSPCSLMQYGLREGDTISAPGSNDPDIYIVNAFCYKRLFLNPVIFTMYGHLHGGFKSVLSVPASARDAFGTSGLFRNCETNAQEVWGLQVTGEDTGLLHHVAMTGAQAVAQDPNFFKKVFCINNRELAWYPKGVPWTSLSQIPLYSRASGE